MAQIDILFEDTRWRAAGLIKLAQAAGDKTLMEFSLSSDFEISILACNDQKVAQLNAEFRGKPDPTNILSWPIYERAPVTPGTWPPLPETGPDMELGDLAISYDTCMREAQESNISFPHHVTHLLVHGTLHLLGFDHINDQDAAVMEELETQILAKLEIADPYRR